MMNESPKILVIYGNKVCYHGSVLGAQSAIDGLLTNISSPAEPPLPTIRSSIWKNSHEKALIYCYGLTRGLISAGCNELKAILDLITTDDKPQNDFPISGKIRDLLFSFIDSPPENYSTHFAIYNTSEYNQKNYIHTKNPKNLGLASCLTPKSNIQKTKVKNCLTRLGPNSILWGCNDGQSERKVFSRMESYRPLSSGLESIGEIFSQNKDKYLLKRTDLSQINRFESRKSPEYENMNDFEFDDDTGDLILLNEDNNDDWIDSFGYSPIRDENRVEEFDTNPFYDRFVDGEMISYGPWGREKYKTSDNDTNQDYMNKSWKTLDSGLYDVSTSSIYRGSFSREQVPLSMKEEKEAEKKVKNKKSDDFFRLSALTTSLNSDMNDFEDGLASLKYRMEASNIELDNMQHDMEDAMFSICTEQTYQHQSSHPSVCCNCNCHEESISATDRNDYIMHSDTESDTKSISNSTDGRHYDELIFDSDNGIQW